MEAPEDLLLTMDLRRLLDTLEAMMVSGYVIELPDGVQLRWLDQGEAVIEDRESFIAEDSGVFKLYIATLKNKNEKRIWMSVGGLPTFRSIVRSSLSDLSRLQVHAWSASHLRSECNRFSTKQLRSETRLTLDLSNDTTGELDARKCCYELA